MLKLLRRPSRWVLPLLALPLTLGWLVAFPPNPLLDWDAILFEAASLAVALIGYAVVARFDLRDLSLGWGLVVLSFLADLLDEFTREPDLFSRDLEGLLRMAGLLLFAHGLSQVYRRRAEAAERSRLAERALRESEARNRLVLAALREGVVLRSADGELLAYNASAERLLGLTAEQIAGRAPRDPTWRALREDGTPLPDEEFPTAVALRAGRPCSTDLAVQRPDGTLTWLAVHAEPLFRAGETAPYAVVTSFSDITERKRIEEVLEHRALHDPLTDLPNRALLHDRLRQAIQSARLDGSHFAVLLVDLAHFKAVNDTYGHRTGDVVLSQVARRLRGALRATDTIARLGGDEFVALLPGADTAGAALAAAKLCRALDAPFEAEGEPIQVGGHVGIAVFPDHGADGEALLRFADAAMYAAKRAGRAYALAADSQESPASREGASS